MYYDEGIADEEPDFTCGESVKFCRHTIFNQFPKREPFVPENGLLRGKYSKACVDNPPTVKDELCDPNWFLATYWPVYVGNFRVPEWGEAPEGDHDVWRRHVSDYFAFRGLMTRMIYFHQDNKDFLTYQRRSMLIDMLVYFISSADANKAIKHCNKESYNGYKLIVLPGRKPVFFDPKRSVLFENLKNNAQFTDTEYRIERTLSPFGAVELSSRRTHTSVIVQFGSVKSMVSAVSSQDKYRPCPVPENTMKQRYLEEDVKMGLLWAKESVPSFMDMRTRTGVLARLLCGKPPYLHNTWRGHTKPMVSDYHKQVQQQGKARIKLVHKKKRQEQRFKKWAKANAAAISGEAKPYDPSATAPSVLAATPEKIEAAKALLAGTTAKTPTTADGGHVKTTGKVKADTLRAINRFRRQHGLKSVFKNDMKRFAKQRQAAALKNA